nr:amidohydrolase [Sinomonas susongensis]
MAELAFGSAAKAVGDDRVSWGPATSASEDFTAYTAAVPGCFLFLGSGDASEGFPFQNHHPYFDIKEAALIPGARLEAQLAGWPKSRVLAEGGGLSDREALLLSWLAYCPAHS